MFIAQVLCTEVTVYACAMVYYTHPKYFSCTIESKSAVDVKVTILVPVILIVITVILLMIIISCWIWQLRVR